MFFENYSHRYYVQVAAAFLRGLAINASQHGGTIQSIDPAFNDKEFFLPDELVIPSIEELTNEEITTIIQTGKDNDMKLHRFKNTHDELPRVRRVLGFLRGVPFESLLDVGSGRGVFLWACMNAFPLAQINAIDLLPQWGEVYDTVHAGGLTRLSGHVGDIADADFPDKSFDVVTLLEVLEHIPDYATAVQAAVRLAKRHIVVSVPSKPDNNPAHIHLLTRDILNETFLQAGVKRLHFASLNTCLLLFATVD